MEEFWTFMIKKIDNLAKVTFVKAENWLIWQFFNARNFEAHKIHCSRLCKTQIFIRIDNLYSQIQFRSDFH